MSDGDLLPGPAVRRVTSTRFEEGRLTRGTDEAVVEEPLEIRVVVHEDDVPVAHTIAVTMRTPGHDVDLVTGFLLAEGIVDDASRVARVVHAAAVAPEARGNVVLAELVPGTPFDVERFRRAIVTSSSCGVCGRTSIESVRRALSAELPDGPLFDAAILVALPDALAAHQGTFTRTGGLHAAASVRPDGTIELVREDVGRHNALDKLVGALARAGKLPASERAALVSGRAGFELVEKALIAGFPLLAAIGAPSSLATELAAAHGQTLIGFLRNGRFNVYSGVSRVRRAGDDA